MIHEKYYILIVLEQRIHLSISDETSLKYIILYKVNIKYIFNSSIYIFVKLYKMKNYEQIIFISTFIIRRIENCVNIFQQDLHNISAKLKITHIFSALK